MSTEVVMPQMGESIAEGTITKWLKKVGERVERDEPLFEISTDKVDAEIPSPSAGTLTEVRFKEGDTVEVNTVVAVLDGDQAAASEAPAAKPVEEPAAKVEPPAPAPAPAQPQQAAPPPPPPPPPAPVPPPPPVQTKAAAPAAAVESESKRDGIATAEDLRRIKSSPLVRKIAQEHGVDISKLEGTGLSGRVTKNDILSFIESGSAPAAAPLRAAAPASAPLPEPVAPALPKPQVGDRVEQMSVMRKKIAEHMVLSRRTSAHVTTVYEIDMTRIARLRDQHRDAFYQRTGTKLTFMPFIFEAVNKGLRKFPIFNAQVNGEQIIYKQDINLGMAVALDWGLIVPVIKRADDLSISGLARIANDLADRARTKQLKPDEVTGGTFTITNPGVFGGLFGTPIINQPQLAILGVGKIEKRAKVMTTPDGDDFIGIRWMAYFALSFDHRVIDGADAERFLAFIKEQLEAGDFSV
ncbi:MAG TPA: 2-oxoglutarate dehydrogenase, E2 component, dihydrolipoamide succinyltransferase [Pyrinomonadaceae bacterium]|jgi:2-oxoglutarate dehydrogenase E2 component (dihydrolipoamide succinyltransferase)|nr:2-oxoglutarate dehydrogenase, E2 component, dihydrolipoamide succinyltransferase [Pyrinomonadaceae bacterium]